MTSALIYVGGGSGNLSVPCSSGGGGGVPLYGPIGSAPAGQPTGTLYYATDTAQLLLFDGTEWTVVSVLLATGSVSIAPNAGTAVGGGKPGTQIMQLPTLVVDLALSARIAFQAYVGLLAGGEVGTATVTAILTEGVTTIGSISTKQDFTVTANESIPLCGRFEGLTPGTYTLTLYVSTAAAGVTVNNGAALVAEVTSG